MDQKGYLYVVSQ